MLISSSHLGSMVSSALLLALLLMVQPLAAEAAADTWTETDTSIYTADPAKNVGIGTDNPQANFAVQGKHFVVGGSAMMGNYSPNDAAFEFQNPVGSVFLNFVSKNGGMVFSSSTYDGGQNGLFSWDHPFVFYMNGKESWRIDPATGNVGIGTTNPEQLLDVAGAIKGDQLCIGSDCRAEWPVSGEDNPWETNGTMLYYNQGNVGIGTVSPQATVDVAGDLRVAEDNGKYVEIKGGGTVKAYSDTAGGSLAVGINDQNFVGFKDQGEPHIVWNDGQGDPFTIRYEPDGRKFFAITSDGNVGIGTTNPQALLHVAGKDNESGIVRITANNDSSSMDGYNYAAVLRMHVNNDGGEGAEAELLAEHDGESGTPGTRLVFKTRKPSYGEITEKMRISANGNVGIGTTDPKYLLDVAGTVRSSELCLSTDCRKTWPTNPWETYENNIIYTASNVGIKRGPGNYALGVAGDVEIDGKVLAGSMNTHTVQINNGGSIEFYDTAGTLRGNLTTTADGLEMYANTRTSFNSELYMRHRVGIGTTPEENQLVTIDGGSSVGMKVESDNIAIKATGGPAQAITAQNNSSSLAAIEGYNPAGMGTAGLSQNGYGIYGWSQNSYAGYFAGPVRVAGDLTVDGDICLGQCN